MLDSVAPVVRITGASTGDAVRPGQQTTVILGDLKTGGTYSGTLFNITDEIERRGR